MLLLTGATGFLGQSTQKALQARELPYRLYDGNISDFEHLRDALTDVETVIHLAGAEARGRPRYLKQVDIRGTETLLSALKFRNVRHLIIISRLNAQPNATHTLLRAKGIVEQSVIASGIPYTILRFATLFGKNDRLTNSIATVSAWTWPVALLPAGGLTALQPLWVEDAARCIAETVGNADLVNQRIDLAGDERMHYREIVQQVLSAANLRRHPLSVRPVLARSLNRATSWMLRRPPVTRFDHDRLITSEVTSLNTVYTHFGFRPNRFHQHLSHLRRTNIRRKLWQM